MFRFLQSHKLYLLLGVGSVLGGSYLLWLQQQPQSLDTLITTTVERGTVENLVSVSGLTQARNTAKLAFPSSGVVSAIYVQEGDTVNAGDIIATLGAEELIATRASAVADLHVAEADRAELLSGDTAATRDITNTKVAIAKAELDRITTTQTVLVDNAQRTLRSSNLSAQTKNAGETAPAPAISGSYRCTQEGEYTLTIYSSGAASGYSMRVEGLESGTYPVSTDQPTAFGTCGLLAQFDATSQYTGSIWTILIPNTTAASYTVNKNAKTAAENNAKSAIAAAREAVTLAEQEQIAANAAPRSEALTRATARIAKASATIALIDAQIADRSIVAPFTGTVTAVDVVVGETAGALPLFTLLATDNIELKARIPEIDITSIALGQSARVIFDAETDTTLTGTVTYIAPLPIQIDGVAYFEITVTLSSLPAWLRGGLNADIDVITQSTPNVLRVPKRYVTTNNGQSFLRTVSGTTIATTSITLITEGNDGFVAIEGVTPGTTVVTP